MFIRSTGLGRTLLTAKVAKIEITTMVPSTLEPHKDGNKEPMRMLMVMEVVNPVHWTVRAFLDPPDLRQMIKLVLLNPGLIFNGIKFLFMKGPKYDAPAKTEAPAQAAAPKAGPGPVPKGLSPIPGASPKGPGAIPPRKQ